MFRVAVVHFYSLSGSQITGPTHHPAAAQSCLRVSSSSSRAPMGNALLFNLWIVKEHVIWHIGARHIEVRFEDCYSIEAYNWRTGQVKSVRVSFLPIPNQYVLML